MRYDPMGRLYEVKDYINGAASGTRTFLQDGDAIAAEYDGSGAMIRRHIHGPAAGVDDPLVTYDSPYVALYYARVLYADPRGSIVLRTDSTGYGAAINTYDEYGIPGGGNIGTFQYTGQVWLPELGMYYYKARIYSPSIGRFLQTDPIGYEDQFNLYAYVANDPVNAVDPTGLDTCVPNPDGGDAICTPSEENVIEVPGTRPTDDKRSSVNLTNSVRITTPYIAPVPLLLHYTEGSGDPVCLTNR